MKRKPRMGRPPMPKGEARGVVFTLRLTMAERDTIVAAAQRAGQPVTRWAREALLGRASEREPHVGA